MWQQAYDSWREVTVDREVSSLEQRCQFFCVKLFGFSLQRRTSNGLNGLNFWEANDVEVFGHLVFIFLDWTKGFVLVIPFLACCESYVPSAYPQKP